MYYINRKLISLIPTIFNISMKKWGDVTGKTPVTVRGWMDGSSISVYDLITTCNWLKISISHFITIEENPTIKGKDEYIIAKESFQHIQFHNEMIGEIYGNGGIIDISKTEFSTKMGVNTTYVDIWIRDPKKMRLSILIKMMNIFQLDIRRFIEDPNRIIELPAFGMKGNSSINLNQMILQLSNEKNNLQEDNKKLTQINDKKEKLIASLSSSIKSLKEENKTYKKAVERIGISSTEDYAGMVSEKEMPYGRIRKSIKFHYELLKSMPEIFDMSKLEFSKMFSLSYEYIYKDEYNINIQKLISICNYFRISIFHFFIPGYELPIIKERGFYEIPKNRFVPINSTLDNLNLIIGRYSILNISFADVKDKYNKSIYNRWLRKDDTNTFKASSIISICNDFDISPALFLNDVNKKNISGYSVSRNETLLLNCIEMKKKVIELSQENKRLKEKIRVIREQNK